MEYFVAVEVGYTLEELFGDGFDFGGSVLDFHFEEACEVVVHILEDEEGGAPEEVAFVGTADDDFL